MSFLEIEGINLPPYAQIDDARRRNFARILQRECVTRGWKYAELARYMNLHMPEGKEVKRNNVSSWIRGKSIPDAIRMNALCKTLNMTPAELGVGGSEPEPDIPFPSLGMQSLGDGNVLLTVHRAVREATALKILTLINEDAGRKPN